MTAQLATQHAELMEAARQMDERRRFTEAVLSGVSAGVIGLDAQGRINLPNRSASHLLWVSLEELVGMRLADIVPEFGAPLDEARAGEPNGWEGEVRVKAGTASRALLLRIGVELGPEGVIGHVLTFDDITDLQSAQRKAAWADVARRIAHEIKNPLTPIQLSAERLKRKYLKEIQSDPEVFIGCTDTIIRQVGDIGRMVDEFSNFARMPTPVMKAENLAELIKESVFLQRNAHKDTVYDVTGLDAAISVRCDGRQVSQALTNILQNAQDAIEGRSGANLPPGRIDVMVDVGSGRVVVCVRDNGKGLPAEERHRLTEPYVTTRAKGTGLGLAIVKKIMEDHGGSLRLDDAPGGGAEVRLDLPLMGQDEAA
jgi:two-component system nitrogen regulation sensor histidine kinase NtrY